MKATKVIEKLQKLVEERGDLDVLIDSDGYHETGIRRLKHYYETFSTSGAALCIEGYGEEDQKEEE